MNKMHRNNARVLLTPQYVMLLHEKYNSLILRVWVPYSYKLIILLYCLLFLLKKEKWSKERYKKGGRKPKATRSLGDL